MIISLDVSNSGGTIQWELAGAIDHFCVALTASRLWCTSVCLHGDMPSLALRTDVSQHRKPCREIAGSFDKTLPPEEEPGSSLFRHLME